MYKDVNVFVTDLIMKSIIILPPNSMTRKESPRMKLISMTLRVYIAHLTQVPTCLTNLNVFLRFNRGHNILLQHLRLTDVIHL